MIVALTRAQHEYIVGHLPPNVADALTCDTTVISPRRVLVRSVFPAWVLARESLYDIAYTTRGTRNTDVPTKLAKALQSIQAGINARYHHPALLQSAVIGNQVDRVPAWRTGETTYSPLAGDQFVVFEPSTDFRQGVHVTRWIPRRTSGEDLDWTCQEASHLRFRADLEVALGWQPHVGAGGLDQ